MTSLLLGCRKKILENVNGATDNAQMQMCLMGERELIE